MGRCFKNENGFTLVEMLVVVILVAVLAAVAIPSYTSYTTTARRKEGESAALTVLTAAKVYYNRNGESFTGSNCDCVTNNIWLNTAEICNPSGNHWSIDSYNVSGATVSFTLNGQGKYGGLSVPLTFNANTGITSISGHAS